MKIPHEHIFEAELGSQVGSSISRQVLINAIVFNITWSGQSWIRSERLDIKVDANGYQCDGELSLGLALLL